jgi:hypothetical protein
MDETGQGDTTSSVGSSPVIFEVDDFTGTAHLKYPIIVPPGRNGLQPSLALMYSSNSPNGWLGVGWDVPVPYIERMGGWKDSVNKRGKKGVPKYDSSDIFVLYIGGVPQELVPSGNNDGEYRLRIEGANYKIHFDGSSWQVWDKNGVKMSFGSTAASRIDPTGTYGRTGVFRWCADRVDDPNTNYIQYFYSPDAGSPYLYLDHILYNAQVSGGLPHNHQIYFTLESTPRPDPIYNYKGGFRMLTQKRLSSIDVKTLISGSWGLGSKISNGL